MQITIRIFLDFCSGQDGETDYTSAWNKQTKKKEKKKKEKTCIKLKNK